MQILCKAQAEYFTEECKGNSEGDTKKVDALHCIHLGTLKPSNLDGLENFKGHILPSMELQKLCITKFGIVWLVGWIVFLFFLVGLLWVVWLFELLDLFIIGKVMSYIGCSIGYSSSHGSKYLERILKNLV